MAEAAVARAAAREGVPESLEAAFGAPLMLLPFRASELPPEVKQAANALVESNMRAVYDASGWSEENEAPDGLNGELLYLLLFQQPGAEEEAAAAAAAAAQSADDDDDDDPMASLVAGMLGFVSAEFSVESGKPALYIVELQLAPKAQRRGLGARLTLAAESLAWSRGLERVVLTVQTANAAALTFYDRQGYVADETSPEQCPDDFVPEDRTYKQEDGSMGFSYRILSKERPPTSSEADAAAIVGGEERDEREGAPSTAKRRRTAE